MIKSLKFAALTAVFLLPTFIFGQKIGHVNSQKLLELMPQVVVANKKLDTLNNQYQTSMKELTDKYQTLVTAYQDPSQKWSEAVRADKEKEIMQLQDRIMSFKETANDDMTKKTQELMDPIQKKLKDAITAVAKESGYTYILDDSMGTVLYAADTEDVTDMVKKKLNLGATPPPKGK